MQELTPEQQEDINSRVGEFRNRHQANVTELEVDFVSMPQYMEVAPGVFATMAGLHLVDKKFAAVPSPLANDGGEAVEL